MLGQAHGLLRIPRPGKRAALKAFVQQQEAVAFPQEAFDAVAALAAEQEERIRLEGIQLITTLYDLRQTIDPLAQIRIAANDDKPGDAVGFIKHEPPPLPA